MAIPGSPVDLLFAFFGDGGTQAGTEIATVDAPEKGEGVRLVVTFAGRALSYRYELIGAVIQP